MDPLGNQRPLEVSADALVRQGSEVYLNIQGADSGVHKLALTTFKGIRSPEDRAARRPVRAVTITVKGAGGKDTKLYARLSDVQQIVGPEVGRNHKNALRQLIVHSEATRAADEAIGSDKRFGYKAVGDLDRQLLVITKRGKPLAELPYKGTKDIKSAVSNALASFKQEEASDRMERMLERQKPELERNGITACVDREELCIRFFDEDGGLLSSSDFDTDRLAITLKGAVTDAHTAAQGMRRAKTQLFGACLKPTNMGKSEVAAHLKPGVGWLCKHSKGHVVFQYRTDAGKLLNFDLKPTPEGIMVHNRESGVTDGPFSSLVKTRARIRRTYYRNDAKPIYLSGGERALAMKGAKSIPVDLPAEVRKALEGDLPTADELFEQLSENLEFKGGSGRADRRAYALMADNTRAEMPYTEQELKTVSRYAVELLKTQETAHLLLSTGHYILQRKLSSKTQLPKVKVYRKDEKLGEGTFGVATRVLDVGKAGKSKVAKMPTLARGAKEDVQNEARKLRELRLKSDLPPKAKLRGIQDAPRVVTNWRNDEQFPGFIGSTYQGDLMDVASGDIEVSQQAIMKGFGELASGMNALHENGLLHGDVKSGNIFVKKSGDDVQFHIADFGGTSWEEELREAWFADPPVRRLPTHTPGYVSVQDIDALEDAIASGDFDAYVAARKGMDVFGLAASMVDIMLGEDVFWHGGTDNAYAEVTLEDHLDYITEQIVTKGYPEDIALTVASMMDPDLSERMPAHEVLQSLEGILTQT